MITNLPAVLTLSSTVRDCAKECQLRPLFMRSVLTGTESLNNGPTFFRKRFVKAPMAGTGSITDTAAGGRSLKPSKCQANLSAPEDAIRWRQGALIVRS